MSGIRTRLARTRERVSRNKMLPFRPELGPPGGGGGGEGGRKPLHWTTEVVKYNYPRLTHRTLLIKLLYSQLSFATILSYIALY
jgi:hypothetical protein